LTISTRTIWITGLSGAGKSTLGRSLCEYLRKLGEPVVFLDGDEIRRVFGADTFNQINHTRKARFAHAKQYGLLCQLISKQGITVIIATISMFADVHNWNRENLTGYQEVFIDVPLDELKRRDSKQIYSRAVSGELKNVAGVNFEVDIPQRPDIHLKWKKGLTENDMLKDLIDQLKWRK